MSAAEQLEFPSLTFPKDRRVLYPHELAALLRCSVDHIYDLIDEGKIRAVDISGANNISERRTLRIPVESWGQFVTANTI